jgi:hypothetical protein
MCTAAGDEGISRTPGHDLVVVEPLQGAGYGPRGGLGMAMRHKIPRRALAALRLQPSEPQ